MVMQESGARATGLCPHMMTSSSCPFCKQEKQQLTNAYAKAFLFGNLGLTEIPERLEALRKEARERGEKNGPVDYFEGSFNHELANFSHANFFEYATGYAEKQLGKPIDQLTQEEMQECFESFPEKQKLLGLEEAALTSYRAAAQGTWEVQHINEFEATLQAQDLLWRAATRLPAGAERERAFDALDAQMTDINKDAQAKHGVSIGKNDEYKFIQMFRRWAREKGLDHLISVEHTLPRDDRKNKVDLFLRVGNRQYLLDQKTLSPDEYQREWQEKKLAEASANVARVGGALLHFESDHFHNAYTAEMSGKGGSRAKGHMIEVIQETLPKEKEILDKLFAKKEKVIPEKLSKKEMRKEIENFFDVNRLVSLGMLAPEHSNTIPEILRVKKIAVEQAVMLMKKKNDLEDSDLIEKIKQAVNGA